MEKVPNTMIGKATEPLIVGSDSPLPYFAHRNAWIDIPSFNSCSDKVFIPFFCS